MSPAPRVEPIVVESHSKIALAIKLIGGARQVEVVSETFRRFVARSSDAGQGSQGTDLESDPVLST